MQRSEILVTCFSDCKIPADNAPRVLVAMSGGVDSSVCAALLLEAGYNVDGATMQLFEAKDLSTENNDGSRESLESSCCPLADVQDARYVCNRLGIKHHTFDLKQQFRFSVMDKFCHAYLAGRTPNPCIDCNRYLKFGELQRLRQELGADYLATGHYVRTQFNEASGRWELLRAKDLSKDQSYVLYHLSQKDLATMIFPLGNLTKDEVRNLARDHGFANADKEESQDICFVPDGDYVTFIASHLGRDKVSLAASNGFIPGPIMNLEGKIFGQHQGLIHYTIGQRKGIGIAAERPLYVVAKNPETHSLVVGFKEDLDCHGVIVRDVNFVSVAGFPETRKVTVKTSYRQEPRPAEVEQTSTDELRIIFDGPMVRSAAGQSAVVYDDNRVLAGGTIEESF